MSYWPPVLLFSALLSLASMPALTQETPAIDPASTWDLTDLFPTLDAWNAERERLLGEFDKIAAYKGTLGNSSGELISEMYGGILRRYHSSPTAW